MGGQMSLSGYGLFWVINIPVVLGLCKWYFKMEAPTLNKGFMLGVFALIVGVLLDAILLSISSSAASVPFQQMAMELYGDWRFYVALAEVLLLTTYAGFEFDGTYTKPE